VHVPHALGHAGGARRVEPERGLVAAGVGSLEFRRLELQLAAQGKGERRRLAAGNEYVLEEWQLSQYRLHSLQQRRRHEQGFGSAVAQNVCVLLGREQGVEADRYDAGLDGAPEGDREVDSVQQQQGDTRFAGQLIGGEQVAHAVAARLQLAVGQRLAGIDERRLRPPAVQDVAVDHIDSGVVGARILHGSSPEIHLSTVSFWPPWMRRNPRIL
jgi:hypothetical protein